MPLYTFMLEFKGGTYFSQLEAVSALDAYHFWAAQLDASEIEDFEESYKEKLITQLIDDELASLEGLTNVWCSSALLGDELAFVNIVQTDKTADNRPLTTDN